MRDRAWRVLRAQQVAEGRLLLEAEATSDGEPRAISVVAPPDVVVRLPAQAVELDARGLEAFRPWALAHQVLDATRLHSPDALSGARHGRVAPEVYQLTPVRALLSRPRPRLLVADDVGLGKTIEAGLVILELMARGRAGRVLVVAPPGLLEQWRLELAEKFHLAFQVVENSTALAGLQTTLPAGISPWDCLPGVITSVDFLKKETVRNRALRKAWDLIIVDEAHALAESGTPQNPYRTNRTRLGLALREACRALLLLTATPHNGHEHSLRSLIDLVEPTAATLHGEDANVRRRVGGAMVRRLKSQISRRTPDGSEVPVFPARSVDPLPVRLEGRDAELLRKVASYCSKTASDAAQEENAELVSFAMQIVRKRALSTRAALARTVENRLSALSKEEEQEPPPERAELRDFQADLPLSEAAAERTARRILRSAMPPDERRRKAEAKALRAIQKLLRACRTPDPKIAALLEALQRLQAESPGEKVIVFTEYRDSLVGIRDAFESEPALHGRSLVLHGGLSLRRRLRIQEAFETPDVLVLLATDAASEGLNLQRQCRRVIHFELPWNPNRLEQRNGRVDRYGQVREPIIRYLYYPDSPEDDVLNRLVAKIERMRENRVATPDILGVVAGLDGFERTLVGLDPETGHTEEEKDRLLGLVDAGMERFGRRIQPLLAEAAGHAGAPTAHDDRMSAPLLADDPAFERLLVSILGPSVRPLDDNGLLSIEVPALLRGPGVASRYPAATCRRGVAMRARAGEIEFLTPIHPLAQALGVEARRRLAQAHVGDGKLTPRRLAARRAPSGDEPSIVFTFLGTMSARGRPIEERLFAVRVNREGAVIESGETPSRWLDPDAEAGEVPVALLRSLFEPQFEAMRAAAESAAAELVARAARRARESRGERARLLLEHLEIDTTDRLAELALLEARARSGGDERSGQMRLALDGPERVADFGQRREVVRRQAAARREEIEAHGAVDDPATPTPLGALLLVPEGAV